MDYIWYLNNLYSKHPRSMLSKIAVFYILLLTNSITNSKQACLGFKAFYEVFLAYKFTINEETINSIVNYLFWLKIIHLI